MDLIERIFINVRGKKSHSDGLFIAKTRVTEVTVGTVNGVVLGEVYPYSVGVFASTTTGACLQILNECHVAKTMTVHGYFLP